MPAELSTGSVPQLGPISFLNARIDWRFAAQKKGRTEWFREVCCPYWQRLPILAGEKLATPSIGGHAGRNRWCGRSGCARLPGRRRVGPPSRLGLWHEWVLSETALRQQLPQSALGVACGELGASCAGVPGESALDESRATAVDDRTSVQTLTALNCGKSAEPAVTDGCRAEAAICPLGPRSMPRIRGRAGHGEGRRSIPPPCRAGTRSATSLRAACRR